MPWFLRQINPVEIDKLFVALFGNYGIDLTATFFFCNNCLSVIVDCL